VTAALAPLAPLGAAVDDLDLRATVAVGGAGERALEDLLRDARALAGRLSRGAPAEVLVICEDRYHVATAALAAWACGHAIALPPSGQRAAVERLARDSRVCAVIHDRDAPSLPAGAAPTIDARAGAGAGDDVAPVEIGAPLEASRHVATVYTSGSTGDSLACKKSAGHLLGEAALLARTFGLAGARVVATVPAHHIYGLLFGVLAPLAARAAFHREAPLHAETLASLVARDRVDVLVSVPAHLRGLEVLAEGALTGLRRVFSSSAPLPAETARLLLERFGLPTTEVFGSSETGGIAWRESPGAPAWRPLPGVRVGAAEDGRLLLDSPFLPDGGPRPWVGDDAVEVAADGTFAHLGRVDGVIKVGGKRVALAEVERLLLAQPGVRDAAVVALDVGGARERELVAAVAPADLDPARLRAALRDALDPVVVPRRVHALAALPREPNGKLPRARLLEALGLASNVEPALDPGQVLVRATRALEGPGEGREVDLDVPADLPAFVGHFDEFALLPGVFQLDRVAIPQARAAWSDLGPLRAVKKLKFTRPIRPGDALLLRLTRTARAGEDEVAVAFELTRAGAPCSTGVLLLARAKG
jgi:4-coumarate--CoA ligase (photoactive yellow protein activation family)